MQPINPTTLDIFLTNATLDNATQMFGEPKKRKKNKNPSSTTFKHVTLLYSSPQLGSVTFEFDEHKNLSRWNSDVCPWG